MASAGRSLLKRISVDPKKMGGRPMIGCWRISVAQILTWLANGESRKKILEEYPRLKSEDIDASLLYAALVVGRERAK